MDCLSDNGTHGQVVLRPGVRTKMGSSWDKNVRDFGSSEVNANDKFPINIIGIRTGWLKFLNTRELKHSLMRGVGGLDDRVDFQNLSGDFTLFGHTEVDPSDWCD
jgi:hypothetical protein